VRKFLAVVKHEYRRVVLKWSFLIGTLLLPFLAACAAIVPAVILSMKGEPTRIVLVDPSGSIAPRLKEKLSAERLVARARQSAKESMTDISASQEDQMRRTSEQFVEGFVLTDYDIAGREPADIRRELITQVAAKEIDGFLLVPEDPTHADAVYEFRSRRAGDFIINETFKDALNEAVRSQRLAEANISESQLDALSGPVRFDLKGIDERGEEKDSSGAFMASFAIGLMIYITLAIYGQAIMGAVVEEKETRIAEILFSSAKPFVLMMGKLAGVGLAGLTQLAIWVTTAAALISVLAMQGDLAPILGAVPQITPLMVVYFLVFFLLGFFLYASIFALIGSMVTSMQEGGQFAFPPILIMMVAFYFSFAVIRDPNSPMSFWASVAPFMAPITMPVRIIAEVPPFWQIAFAIMLNAAAIVGIVWLTSRVYRIGMLMYGKRATIPEVLRWMRQH
jgi:ABC-2 type transport system permease protein